MTQSVAVREGLYREASEGVVLTGGKCLKCKFIGFPQPQTCPECGSECIESVDLGAQGTLLCETTVHMRTEKYAAGYSVGYVTMAHGVRVFGQLWRPATGTLRPGDAMAVEVAPLWKEGDKEVMCYRFRPMAQAAGSAV